MAKSASAVGFLRNHAIWTYLFYTNPVYQGADSKELEAEMKLHKDKRFFVTARNEQHQNAFHYYFQNKEKFFSQPSMFFDQNRKIFFKRLDGSWRTPIADTNMFCIKENSHALCLLLQPFLAGEGESELTEALCALDSSGMAPLHYAFSSCNTPEDAKLIGLVLERIKAFKNVDNKKAIAKVLTSAGKRNIFHFILAGGRVELLQQFIDACTTDGFKDALIQLDNGNDTGLHLLLKSNIDVLAKLQAVKNAAANSVVAKAVVADHKASVTKEDAPVGGDQKMVDQSRFVKSLFSQNREGHNPLHLAALKEKEILETTINLCPKDIYLSKLAEKDHLENTPLHYVVRTNNVDKLDMLLKDIKQHDKERITNLYNRAGESLLHVACQYGSKNMVRAVARALGAQNVFEIRRAAKDDFTKQFKSNRNFTVDEYETLMQELDPFSHLYLYLIEKYGTGIRVRSVGDPDFEIRKEDFKGCLNALRSGKDLPKENPQISKGDSKKYSTRRRILENAVRGKDVKEWAEKFTEFLKWQAENKKCPVAFMILGIVPKKESKAASTTTNATTVYENFEWHERQAEGFDDFDLVDAKQVEAPGSKASGSKSATLAILQPVPGSAPSAPPAPAAVPLSRNKEGVALHFVSLVLPDSAAPATSLPQAPASGSAASATSTSERVSSAPPPPAVSLANTPAALFSVAPSAPSAPSSAPSADGPALPDPA